MDRQLEELTLIVTHFKDICRLQAGLSTVVNPYLLTQTEREQLEREQLEWSSQNPVASQIVPLEVQYIKLMKNLSRSGYAEQLAAQIAELLNDEDESVQIGASRAIRRVFFEWPPVDSPAAKNALMAAKTHANPRVREEIEQKV